MGELGILSLVVGIVLVIIGKLFLRYKETVSKIFWASKTIYHPQPRTVIFAAWLAILMGIVFFIRGLYLLIF